MICFALLICFMSNIELLCVAIVAVIVSCAMERGSKELGDVL